MSMQQSEGGLSNAHADEHGGPASVVAAQSAVPPVQAQLPAPPEEAQAAVPPGQAQLPAPPEEAQAAVPPGQAQPPPGSVTNASPSEGLTGDIDMPDEGEPKKLSDSNLKNMIRDILNAPPNDPNAIRRAWEKNIPDDCNLNFKHLMAVLHPDKFAASDKAEAETAFSKVQWAGSELERLFPGEVNKNHHFFQGGGSGSQPHIEENLSSYHKEAHEQATPHIQSLYAGLQKNPRSNLLQGAVPVEIRKAADLLDEINNKLKGENLRMEKDPELGIIRYTELLAVWRPIFISPELGPSQMQVIKNFCNQFHYPSEWAVFPNPQSNPNNDSQPLNSNSHSNQPSASHHGLNQADLQLQPVSTGSNKRTIALVPRRVVRSINPGYTSTGERIHMIQQLGFMGARFVVEDNSGRIRLMSSSATGGQLAIDGARAAGVPDTLRGEEALINLQRLIRAHFGGTYGLNWVAVGEVDPTHDKYPFMLVGFFFEGPNGNPPLMEVGLSRSALKKIISPREADRLISEALTYDSNVALEDAISGLAGLSIKSGGNPIGLPAAPQASLLGYHQHPTQQPAQPSLFGSKQHPTQQPAQPSLFGSNQQPQMQQPAQPSLFGSNQRPQMQQPAQASLFGSNQQPQMQQPAQPSLFGSNQKPQMQQPAKPSLFGSNRPQMQQPAKQSLFGSNRPQMQQPAQASLFGSNQQPQMQLAYNQQPSAQSNEEL